MKKFRTMYQLGGGQSFKPYLPPSHYVKKGRDVMAYGVILGQTPTPDFPVGGIILWSGSTSNIPTKWQLCDGTNGTPDLRNRFVVGAGSNYDVGDTGGEATHTLTVNEMPSHNHTFSGNSHTHSLSLSGLTTSSAGAHTHSIDIQGTMSIRDVLSASSGGYRQGSFTTKSAGEHTHTISGSGTLGSTVATGTISNKGSSRPHNNLPPYYALCYIMKIA